MKIIKRHKYLSPISSIMLWMGPTITYTVAKLAGAHFNQYEYIWGIAIPSLFIVWFTLNFKLSK